MWWSMRLPVVLDTIRQLVGGCMGMVLAMVVNWSRIGSIRGEGKAWETGRGGGWMCSVWKMVVRVVTAWLVPEMTVWVGVLIAAMAIWWRRWVGRVSMVCWMW